jgi:hypothetical protein
MMRRVHLASLVGICLACGNSFQSGGGSAGAGGQGLQNSAGNGHPSGGTSSGGTVGAAGTGKGGRSGTAGATGTAGAPNTGGSGGTVGSAGTAGNGGINVAGVGGTTMGGGGTAGSSMGGTAGSGQDCSALLQDYTDLLAKARECNPNALLKECALDSTLPMPPSLCCPTPVNTSSQFTLQARQALNDYRASCVPPPCLQVLCTAPGTVDCFQVTSGPGDFRCSSTNVMTQN